MTVQNDSKKVKKLLLTVVGLFAFLFGLAVYGYAQTVDEVNAENNRVNTCREECMKATGDWPTCKEGCGVCEKPVYEAQQFTPPPTPGTTTTPTDSISAGGDFHLLAYRNISSLIGL